MKTTTLLSVVGLLALLALAGCSKGEGGAAAEVKGTTSTSTTVDAKPPATIGAPAAQNPNAFAEAMKKQAQQGTPK